MRGVGGYKQGTTNVVKQAFICRARANPLECRVQNVECRIEGQNLAGPFECGMQNAECRMVGTGRLLATPHFAVVLKYGGVASDSKASEKAFSFQYCLDAAIMASGQSDFVQNRKVIVWFLLYLHCSGSSSDTGSR